MARNTIYYHDWTDEQSSIRYRLEIVPPNNAGVALTASAAPNWGATSGTGYSLIPDLAIVAKGVGATSYPSAYPMGLPSTPTYDVTFDFSQLLTGDLTDLRQYLRERPFSTGINYAIPGGSSHTLDASTTPVITVFTDSGSTTSNLMSAFGVAFQGAVLRNPTRRSTFSYANDSATRTITFAHIFRAVTEAVTMESLAQYCLTNLNTTGSNYVYDDGDDHANTFFYESIWTDGGKDYAVCAGTRGTAENRFKARCFSVRALFDGIEGLIQGVYQQYIRRDTATFSFGSIDRDGATWTDASAYDHIHLLRRDYTIANEDDFYVDGGVATSIQQKDHTYFIAAGWEDTTVDYAVDSTDLVDAYTAGNLIFGLFVAADPDSIHSYPHLYDLMVDLVGGGACKGVYDFEPGGTSMELNFATIGGETGGTSSLQRIKASDLYIDGDIEIEEGAGAGAIRQFRVSLPGMGGEDITDVAVASLSGTLGDSEAGLSLFFHTAPHVGDEGDFFRMKSSVSGLANDDMSATDYIVYGHTRYSCRRLYYFYEPTGITNGAVPILCHETVEYDSGWGTLAFVGNAQAHANFSEESSLGGFGGETTGSSNDKANIILIRARALTHQSEAGIGYAIASELMNRFTGFNMWKGDFTVYRSKAPFSRLGERYHLVDESNVSTGLPILTPTASSDYSDFTHYGYAVAVAWSDDGFATLTLLGVDT